MSAPPKNVPKILLIDLETSPNIAYTWGKYEQDALGDFIQERMIICFAWKWLGKPGIQVKAIPDFYGYKPSPKKNKKLIESLHSLFSSADIIVAQNGDSFDVKMANAEFVQYGLAPPPPYKTIDTLKIARAKFRFNSNKLDDIGHRLGLGRKVKTGGFDLWLGVMRGEKSAWDKMREYNKQDVILLEKIYMKFRPWTANHPNMNVFDGHPGCPACRSANVVRNGFNMTRMGRKRRYHCMDCGKWSLGQLEKPGLTLS